MAGSESTSKQVLDIQVFNQILEMDDDPIRREFSSEIVSGFFDQTGQALISMEKALEKGDFPTLGCLGEYVKGSAATLGLEKVSESGRKIHSFGFRKFLDEMSQEGNDELILSSIRQEIAVMRHEITQAREALDALYDENNRDAS